MFDPATFLVTAAVLSILANLIKICEFLVANSMKMYEFIESLVSKKRDQYKKNLQGTFGQDLLLLTF